jgi:hypothetical protein
MFKEFEDLYFVFKVENVDEGEENFSSRGSRYK